MLYHFPQEGVVLIAHEVIKADAAADKDLLDAGEFPELTKETEIVLMIHLQIFTGSGEQTLAVGAYALGELLGAAGVAEVCRGAAYIMDIALEVRVRNHLVRLIDDGLVAAGLDDAALVERQCAEIASAKAAAVAGQTEFDLLNGRDTSGRFVAGVVGPHIGEGVDTIHLLCGQRFLGGILHHIAAFGLIRFYQSFCHIGIGVAVLGVEAFRIGTAALIQCLPGGKDQVIVEIFQGRCFIDGAPDVGQIRDGKAAVQSLGYLQDTAFTHAVEQQVRLGVQQEGTLHFIAPVVIVGKAAKACFDAAHNDGLVGVRAADEVAVNDGGVVRPLAHDAAGGKGVGLAALFGDGIVVHHGVHIAAHHQKAQTGLAQDLDGIGVFPIRLGDDAHFEAGIFQHARDDGMAKGGMVHIGIANDIYKITLFPAPFFHIGPGDG